MIPHFKVLNSNYKWRYARFRVQLWQCQGGLKKFFTGGRYVKVLMILKGMLKVCDYKAVVLSIWLCMLRLWLK
jgi:hypothetical protein